MKSLLKILTFAATFLVLGSVQAQHSLSLSTFFNNANISSDVDSDAQKPRNSVGFALDYSYGFAKGFSAGLGVQYSPMGYAVEVEFTDQAGGSIGTERLVNAYNYLYVPIKIGYQTEGKFFVSASAGFAPGFLLSEDTEASFALGNAKSVDLSYLADFGFGYRINENISVKAFGGYQGSFITFDEPETLNGRHRAIRAGVGIGYQF